ncbi:MAG: TIGR02757 family protein [Desulfobacteraceae bacterium]|nr:TIGR02757 family protein [Desulfobacteraceae bacterium]
MNPEPLLSLYDYPDIKDREIAGFISASLAFGMVSQIMRKTFIVLSILGKSPYEYIVQRNEDEVIHDFRGFQYRFVSGKNMANLVLSIKDVIAEYGSLENCFLTAWSKTDDTILPGLIFLNKQVLRREHVGYLVADPAKNSACKRSNLFLRWMVRKDAVDPGGWDKISRSQLIVPLDVHMFKTGKMLNFTKRKSPDMKTAMEITQGFKKIVQDDPVKYDFALTRFGIRKELNLENLKERVSYER